jgi:hypothetical protein
MAYRSGKALADVRDRRVIIALASLAQFVVLPAVYSVGALAPLLREALHLSREQIVRFLLGQEGLDARQESFCQIVQPAVSLSTLPVSTEVKQALSTLVLQAWETCQPLRLYFQGPRHAGACQTSEALAASVY